MCVYTDGKMHQGENYLGNVNQKRVIPKSPRISAQNSLLERVLSLESWKQYNLSI